MENSLQIRHIRVENYRHLGVGSHPNKQILRHCQGEEQTTNETTDSTTRGSTSKTGSRSNRKCTPQAGPRSESHAGRAELENRVISVTGCRFNVPPVDNVLQGHDLDRAFDDHFKRGVFVKHLPLNKKQCMSNNCQLDSLNIPYKIYQ